MMRKMDQLTNAICKALYNREVHCDKLCKITKSDQRIEVTSHTPENAGEDSIECWETITGSTQVRVLHKGDDYCELEQSCNIEISAKISSYIDREFKVEITHVRCIK